MRKLFFCARELQDYLSHVKNIDKLNLPAAKSYAPELLDLPPVQEILRSLTESYDGEIFWQTGVDGLRLDFNCGLRLEVPAGNFHVRISDFDSGQIFFDRELSDVRLISVEKYFIRWQVEIFSDGRKIFSHVLNLAGRTIHLAFKKNRRARRHARTSALRRRIRTNFQLPRRNFFAGLSARTCQKFLSRA